MRIPTLRACAIYILLCLAVPASVAYAGQKEDFQAMIRMWTQQAENGNDWAQMNLGVAYQKGYYVERNYKEAARWNKLAAEQGNGHAQANLGVMYRKGQGVEKDHRKALKWFRLSARKGIPWGQYHLGRMYRNGQGVKRDDHMAFHWVHLAVSSGLKEGVKLRDEIAGELGASEQEQVRTEAAACKISKFKNCRG
ncbi:MAG: tetratricopeptide repeat protein [Pseudomonadota bacterium]